MDGRIYKGLDHSGITLCLTLLGALQLYFDLLAMLALSPETGIIFELVCGKLFCYLVYSCYVLIQFSFGLEPFITLGTIFKDSLWLRGPMNLTCMIGFVLGTCKTSVTFSAPGTFRYPGRPTLMTCFDVHCQVTSAGERFLTNIASACSVCVRLLKVFGQVVLGRKLHATGSTNKLS